MISFIIPAYNAEKYIGCCLESIISQSCSFEYEVLVIDDGSIDDTRTVVCEMEQRDSRIQYHYKENGGVSSARNYGLQKCRGEYVVFLDADDYLAQNCFEHLTGYEQFDFTVFGYYYKLTRKTIPILARECRVFHDDVKQGFVEIYRSNMFNSVWNKIYKKAIISELFDENYVMGEDLLFNINYYKNIRNMRVVNEPLYYYCVNENSTTQKYNPSFIYNFIKTYEDLVGLKDFLGIASFPDIEIALVDNVAGTIRLLVYNSQYRYCINELEKIYDILSAITIQEKSKSPIHNCVFFMLKKRWFALIFLMMRLMRTLKKCL